MRKNRKSTIVWPLRFRLHYEFRARSHPLAPAIVHAALVPVPSDPTPDRQTGVRHRAVVLARYRASAKLRPTYRGRLRPVRVSPMYRLERSVSQLSSVVDESAVRLGTQADSYCFLSARIASRAEIIRVRALRSV